jgi:hypothetical protein
MQPGEIYLAQFPFGHVPGMKLRPVLLLTGPIGAIPEVLVAYISSVVPIQLLPSDLLLDPGAAASEHEAWLSQLPGANPSHCHHFVGRELPFSSQRILAKDRSQNLFPHISMKTIRKPRTGFFRTCILK